MKLKDTKFVILDDLSAIKIATICDPYKNTIEKLSEHRALSDIFTKEVKSDLFLFLTINVIENYSGDGYLCITPNTLSILRYFNKGKKSGSCEVIAIDITSATSEEINNVLLIDVYCSHILYLLGGDTFKHIGRIHKICHKNDKKILLKKKITQVELSRFLKVGYDKIFGENKCKSAGGKSNTNKGGGYSLKKALMIKGDKHDS